MANIKLSIYLSKNYSVMRPNVGRMKSRHLCGSNLLERSLGRLEILKEKNAVLVT